MWLEKRRATRAIGFDDFLRSQVALLHHGRDTNLSAVKARPAIPLLIGLELDEIGCVINSANTENPSI